MNPLADWPLKIEAEVVQLEGETELKERLLEMGLTSGTVVHVMSRTPFNGPLIVSVGGGVIALRRYEAQSVLVKRVL